LATLTIQPDSSTGLDTEIQSGQPTSNFEGSTFVSIGTRYVSKPTLGNRRAFFCFSLASLPARAIVSSATLTIYTNTNLLGGASTFTASRVTRTGLSFPGISWNNFTSGSAWTTAGGDFTTSIPAQSSTVVPDNVSNMVFSDAALVGLINDAVANRSNLLSLEIVGPENKGTQWYFGGATCESTNPALRPQLVITYAVPSLGGGMSGGLQEFTGALGA
jgi:hypothetical protein